MPRSWKERMDSYMEDLISRFWKYQKDAFPNSREHFDRSCRTDNRPPVFQKHVVWKNIVVKPGESNEKITKVHQLLPEEKRHGWFGSMKSSQALAQSILGNLVVYEQLSLLGELKDDSGSPLLEGADVSPRNFSMEHEINHLGEKKQRCTSLDGFFSGAHQVAIECKFTENEVGACSRPGLKESAPNYASDHCDGNYAKQKGRGKNCSMSEHGILYWEHIPTLFKWPGDTDIKPCPLYRNYQLVRNVLSVCTRPDGHVSPENGHAVLIYDERNPEFQKDGGGYVAFEETRQALREPETIRKCSWQRITGLMRSKTVLPWLTEQLELKYGL